MERSARTRLSTALVLAVVFGAGIVLGLAWQHGRTPAQATVARADSSRMSQSSDSAGRRRRQQFYGELEATEAQQVRLDSILKQDHDSMRVLTRDFHQDYDPVSDSLRHQYEQKYMPRYHAIVNRTRTAIRAVLTPDQLPKYDSLLAKWNHDDSVRAQSSRGRRRGDHGGDRGGGRGGRDHR
jgi:Spy/CpxP family protein refolding chaperone